MDSNTEGIVRLAWSRLLGLPDDALSTSADGVMVRSDPEVVMFVRLWQHQVLLGPIDVLDRAQGRSGEELADGPALLALCRERRARLLGAATLAFRDAYLAVDELAAVAVTDEWAAVSDLERACPPDDVAEVELSGMDRALVTLDELDRPTAGAGYREWEQIIAHLGVLTPPSFRRRGFGQVAAALAVNDALDRGLVPQWRTRVENVASRGLAARLGFTEVGSQTTVELS